MTGQRWLPKLAEAGYWWGEAKTWISYFPALTRQPWKVLLRVPQLSGGLGTGRKNTGRFHVVSQVAFFF